MDEDQLIEHWATMPIWPFTTENQQFRRRLAQQFRAFIGKPIYRATPEDEHAFATTRALGMSRAPVPWQAPPGEQGEDPLLQLCFSNAGLVRNLLWWCRLWGWKWIACPACGQGSTCRARIPRLRIEVYVCDECDATWT